MPTADNDTLKLTVDSKGIVWYIDADGPPTCSHINALSFVAGITSDAIVRVVGTVHNARLITYLYQLRDQRSLAEVELCGPQLAPTTRQLCDPVSALYNMRRWSASPSVGGWHSADPLDYLTYSIVLQQEAILPTSCERLLHNHPAGIVCDFVYGINLQAMSKLVATILDPRNFVDPANPSRSGRLASYLGLSPQKCCSINRSSLVTDCWKPKDHKQIGEAEYSRASGWFLWHHRSECLARGFTPQKADQHTSRKLLTFLQLVWLDAIYTMPNPWREPMFIPERFFARPVDALAYQHYLDILKTKRS